jgi:cytoskeletal protein RodZ
MLDKKPRPYSYPDVLSSENSEDETEYVPVGERLRRKREWQHQSLLEISRALKITEKSLKAIEELDVEKLPAQVYARGFVKLYAEFLGLDAEQIVTDFTTELAAVSVNKEQKITPHQLRSFRRTRITITPRIITVVAVILVAIIALVYLSFEVRGFTRAPALTLSSPNDNVKIKENNILVKGKTDPTAEVKINGEKVFVQSDGSFSETIGIGSGINKISVSARSIGGKERVVEREVLVEQKEPTPTPPTSPDTVAGPSVPAGNIELQIKTDEAVWVSVTVDGKSALNATLNVGDEKSFIGKEIKITAGKGNKVQIKQGSGDWKVLSENVGVVRNVFFKETQ